MNIKSPVIKNIIFILLGLFLFFADRLLKILSQNNFFEDKIIGIKNIIYLDFFKNENIAFSLPTGNKTALIISSIILILFIVYYVIKIKKSIKNFSTFQLFNFLLVFIGTISNIIDRIKFGYVIDYINFLNINVFNLADIFIIIGCIIFSIKEIKWSQK